MKKLDIKLNDAECAKLEALSEATGMSKAAVLKRSLQTNSPIHLVLINKYLFEVSRLLDANDTEAARKEIMDLCLTLSL